MRSVNYLVVGFSLVYATQCTAYELSTHALMTNRAYERSVLGSSSSTVLQLGIERWVMNPSSASRPFGASYHEIVDNNGNLVNRVANVNLFETERIPDPLKGKHLQVTGWLMRGAIREDDFPTAKLGPITLITAPAPQDAPDSHVTRVSNHFFDPKNNRALDTALNSTVIENNGFASVKAVDWATGDVDSFATNGLTVADTNYRNHFSLRRAREAMWRALTLRYRDNSGNDQEIAPRTELWRKKYWATVFRSLGNAVHLLQDMAQPQHARNEAHSGVGTDIVERLASGHGTVLENYLDARVNGQSTFTVDVNASDYTIRITPKPLELDGKPTTYPIPRFNRYGDFWSTQSETFSVRKGLADFSNREFFTPANMIGGTTFQSPSPNAADYTQFTDVTPTHWDGTAFTGLAALAKVRVYTRTISDALTGGIPDSPTFTRSIWDRFMQLDSIPLRRNLNHVVFNAQADLLIPRAVAYSAGLIDHFFRGQLEITPPDEGIYSLIDHHDFSGEGKSPTLATSGFKGFKTIKLKLRNNTPDTQPSGGGQPVPQTMTGGTLVAVLKFYRNTAYTDDLTGEPASQAAYQTSRSTAEEIVVSTSVKGSNGNLFTGPVTNMAQTLVFEFSQELPINAVDVQLQVVYRGVLGSEADAVVVQTVDISEPTYLAHMNATDYIKIGDSVYTRAEINAGTSQGTLLRSQVRPTNCIDTTTNQLKDTCFQPLNINFPIKFGSVGAGSFTLPTEKTYHRLAMLAPLGATITIDQTANTNCLPNSPITFVGRRVQTNFIPDGATPPNYTTHTSVDPLQPAVRGVRSWNTIACVQNGDLSVPGATSDDRYTKMNATPLTGNNLKPLAMSGFVFGP